MEPDNFKRVSMTVSPVKASAGKTSPDIQPNSLDITDFKFKYVAEEELLRIVRKVRREKRREQETRLWERYLEENNEVIVETAYEGSEESCENDKVANEKWNSTGVNISSPQEDQLSPSVPRLLTTTDITINARSSGHFQRILIFRHRMGLALDSISAMIQCRPTEPDGPEDLERRRTRSNEFISRFSRNYLFQLRMQVLELRRQVLSASPESPGRHTQHQALLQKLVAAHQTAVQSLQACLNQLPGSLHMMNILGKLQELLSYLCDLSVLRNQLETNAFIMCGCGDTVQPDKISDDLYIKCKEVMHMIEEKRVELDDVCSSGQISSPLRLPSSVRTRPRLGKHQAMGSARHATWKRSAAQLAHMRFGPSSSMRSSTSPRLSSRERPSSDENNKGVDDGVRLQKKSAKNEANMGYLELTRPESEGSEYAAQSKHKQYLVEKEHKSLHAAHKSKACCRGESLSLQGVPKDSTPHLDMQSGVDAQDCLSSAQLKELVLHMHKIVCHKHRHRHCKRQRNKLHTERCSVSANEQKALTEVHNLAKNVQLVVMRHDPETETHFDVATDTADIDSKSEQDRTDTKTSKRVGWLPQDQDKREAIKSTSKFSSRSSVKDVQDSQKWQHIASYRERFHTYKEELQNADVHRLCEEILDAVFLEVATELEPSILLEKMYNLEFQE